MIVVMGGINLDTHLRSRSGDMQPGTSNPSVFTAGAGGVACNVARNLQALGDEVRLLGVVGTDALSDALIRALELEGLATSGILRDSERGPGVYAAMLHASGGLACAASAMEATDALDHELAGNAPASDTARVIRAVRFGVRVAAMVVARYEPVFSPSMEKTRES